MKKLFAAIIVALPMSAISVMSAYAADNPATPQQSKMAGCSKQNKGLKGDEFKQAQKECLSKNATAAKPAGASEKPVSQKSKMSACSKENKGLKGDEYKTAQKNCLSK